MTISMETATFVWNIHLFLKFNLIFQIMAVQFNHYD